MSFKPPPTFDDRREALKKAVKDLEKQANYYPSDDQMQVRILTGMIGALGPLLVADELAKLRRVLEQRKT